MKVSLTLGLLFHANFPFSAHFPLAYQSCYRKLPEIMRNNPEIPINWHVSAPLLQQISWEHPEWIEEFRDLCIMNHFELLGSSYAQNILYACSKWINRQHLNWHKELVKNLFPNLEIKGFWNPERVWFNDIVNLISSHNYKYTLIETDILEKAKLVNSTHVNRLFKIDSKELDSAIYLFPDNQLLKDFTNKVIWTGQFNPFLEYLEKLRDSLEGDIILCYAEDAEATGFWQFARGLNYRTAHENLDKFFKELNNHSWIDVKLFSEIIKCNKSFDINNIPKGQATWMVDSVKYDGYKDWFEYIQKSPEIQYFQEYHQKIENLIRNLPNHLRRLNLTQETITLFLTQQFEFGCAPGSFGTQESRYLMNVPGHQLWDDRQTILTLLEWIKKSTSLTNSPPQWKNRGRNAVIEWINNTWISQWTPLGGRCTFLVDRKNDTIISPNIYYSSQDQLTVYNVFPQIETKIKYSDIQKTIRTHGNLFSDFCQIDNHPLGRTQISERYMDEKGTYYKSNPSLAHTPYNATINPQEPLIKFWYSEDGFFLKKKVFLPKNEKESFKVDYMLKNTSERMQKFNLIITNELSPFPKLILDNGISSLKEEINSSPPKGEKSIKIYNTNTERGIEIYCHNKSSKLKSLKAWFAKRHRWIFNLRLSPEEKYSILFTVEHIV